MTELERKLRLAVSEKTDKLLPENIRYGVTIFGITGTQKEVHNQIKQITENGTYEPDEDYTGFSNVVVNVPTGGIDTTTDNPILSDDVVIGKEGWANNNKIIGTLRNDDTNNIVLDTVTDDELHFKTTLTSKIIENITDIIASVSSVANKIDLTPDKIVKGNTVLGIVGITEPAEQTNDELENLMIMCDLYEDVYSGKYIEHEYTEQDKNNIMNLVNLILEGV